MVDADWSQGYVTDASYTDIFFRELSPAWLNYTAALNGVEPLPLDRPFTYLELGCGFGSSVVVNAGAFPQGEFHACDFNPAHVEGGARHAAALGIGNVHFHLTSFDDLRALELPPFDFIVLHGVYSWVGAEARRAIRRVVADRLKAGGLVYVSYNCLPGWAIEVPLRRMLVELSAAGEGTSAERAVQAAQTMLRLSGSRLRFFTANPAAGAAVAAYGRRPGAYLAHEFLNETWQPFYAIDVADEMADIGLTLAGSATLVDNHPPLVMDAQAAEVVAHVPAGRPRQLAIDFAVNQRFRRDVFVRSSGQPARAGGSAYLAESVIGCLGDPTRIEAKIRVPRGEVTFQDEFVRELRSLMGRGSMPLGEIASTLSGGRHAPGEIARNLTFLVAAGTLMPFAQAHAAAPRASVVAAKPIVERAVTLAIERRGPCAIPSEVLGNGVPLQPIEALVLRDVLAGVSADDVPGRVDAEVSKTVRDELVPSLVRLGLVT